MRWVAVFMGVLFVAGCGRGMGETCEQSEQCAGGGTCLKGVCSGYGCEDDSDCADDMVCGSVYSALACVRACSADGDCDGEQTCEDIAESLVDDAPTHLYCM